MYRHTAVITAVLLSAITIILLLSLPPSIWADWQPATCVQHGCFCEVANAESPIRQRANTVSSLGFVFSGMLVIAAHKAGRLPFLYSVVFGLSSIITGVGSAFYHASLTFIGQFLDVLGMFMLAMFMLATFMLVYAIERIWTLRLATTIGLFLTINLFLGWMQFAIPDTRRYAFAIVLIIALLFEAFYRKQNKPNITVNTLRLGVGLLAVAYIIWILDNARLLCIKTSLMQGHAIWHLLGAVSVWFLYEYYASETINREEH
jgi:dihydroceramidase